MKCIYCGWKNPDAVTFCRKCGARLNKPGMDSSLTGFAVSGPLTDLHAEQARSRRRRTVRTLVIILCFLILAGGGIAWWIISSNQDSTEINQALQTYCTALESGDWQTAYNQWSRNTQMSEQDFAYTQQKKPRVTGCNTNNITTSDTTGQVTLTFYYSSGDAVADQINMVLENGDWKIKSQSIS